jgi:hypothetical protein
MRGASLYSAQIPWKSGAYRGDEMFCEHVGIPTSTRSTAEGAQHDTLLEDRRENELILHGLTEARPPFGCRFIGHRRRLRIWARTQEEARPSHEIVSPLSSVSRLPLSSLVHFHHRVFTHIPSQLCACAEPEIPIAGLMAVDIHPSVRPKLSPMGSIPSGCQKTADYDLSCAIVSLAYSPSACMP